MICSISLMDTMICRCPACCTPPPKVMSHEAMHASAPPGHKCSDCTIDGEPCMTCYTAWWKKRHPHHHEIVIGGGTPRIYTRCPACHNDTLVINKGKLLCTWHECPDPTRIDRLGEVKDAGGELLVPLRNWLEWAYLQMKHLLYIHDNPDSVQAGFGTGETMAAIRDDLPRLKKRLEDDGVRFY
jgi:hypothetical protein